MSIEFIQVLNVNLTSLLHFFLLNDPVKGSQITIIYVLVFFIKLKGHFFIIELIIFNRVSYNSQCFLFIQY